MDIKFGLAESFNQKEEIRILVPHLLAITWTLVFIWSQIKSFGHKLSLISNQKKSFTKVSTKQLWHKAS